MRLLLAWKAFWYVLFDRKLADRVDQAFKGQLVPAALPAPEPVKPAKVEKPREPPPPPKPARSEALTLLATLQREARLIDFLKEPIAGYADAQVGAAVRDIHRDCGKVLDRLFALQPVLGDAEGASVEVPKGFDAGRYRLVGNVTGEPPFRGTLTHHGWQATKVEVPAWTGGAESAHVVAPAEVELK